MSFVASFLSVSCFAVSLIGARNNNRSFVSALDTIDDSLSNRYVSAEQHSVSNDYVFTPLSSNGSGWPGDDCYEANDSREYATYASHPDEHTLSSYKTIVSANLLNKDGYLDVDYYSFVLLSDSHFSFSCISSSPFYRVLLEGLNYSGLSNGKAIQTLDVVYDDWNYDCNKQFSFYLKAGTYYLSLELIDNQTSAIDYSFNVSVTKLPRDEILDIVDVRFNKRASAAIWVSDLLYVNLPHYLSFEPGFVYYDNSLSSNPAYIVPDLAWDKVRELSNGNDILLSDILIWDVEIIRFISDFLSELSSWIDEIRIQYERNYAALENADSVEVSISNLLSVAGFVIQFIPQYGDAMSKTVTATEYVASFVFDIIRELFRERQYSISVLVNYIASIKTLFDATANSSSNFVRKPLHIPCYYSLHRETHHTGRGPSTLLYSERNRIFGAVERSGLFFQDDSYSVGLQASGYCSGRIIVLKNSEDGLMMGSPSEFANDIEIRSLPLGIGVSTPWLVANDYAWFKFEAPAPGMYHFTFDVSPANPTDASVEFFGSLAIDSSTSAGIASYLYDEYLYHELQMEAGETVYIRVRGNSWAEIRNGSLTVGVGSLSPLIHLYHSFTHHCVKYPNRHVFYCECGASESSIHNYGPLISNGSTSFKVCKTCGYTWRSGGF